MGLWPSKNASHSNSLPYAAQGLISCPNAGIKAQAHTATASPMPAHTYCTPAPPHTYLPPRRESAAAPPLSAKACSALCIAGAWGFPFLVCVLGCSFIRIFVTLNLGIWGRRIYVCSTFSYGPFSSLGFPVTHLHTLPSTHHSACLVKASKLLPIRTVEL